MSALSQISIFPATSATAVRLAELLQQQQPQIRIRLAGRSPAKLQASNSSVTVSQTPLEVGDAASIKEALDGSDAAYIMNPPFYGEQDPFSLSQKWVDSITEAVKSSSTIKKIVYLSSVGAERTSGTGPIRNTHIAEQGLLANVRDGVEVYALRPPYFLSNLKAVLPLAVGPPHILPSMMVPFDRSYQWTDANAIASTALKYLLAPASPDGAKSGHITAVQLVTQKKTVPEIAQYISEITGTQVNAVPVPQEEWYNTFKKAGMHDDQAQLFVDMATGQYTGYIDSIHDEAAVAEEKKRGVTVVSEHPEVDHKAALKQLLANVGSAH
ncbi:NAD(P)-binding domain protein [Kalmanozyma brasiliensis GHG001]|uniref:NmrA-like domain-containing protein n=1 Tax=Kalmanozyma brasiliensis (strain GHG001) TaxID=1365824 RepID=V5E9T8_KALBG|nr:NAD(P)-binding domain protein [Kalmanozyma brasiliensis GHG001]EST07101.1 NAD(P)-binding domain protein [Kalmanozyma brasiliensis GHG001]